eukprot:1348328-Lingulodinium_polyedra.AAC.1
MALRTHTLYVHMQNRAAKAMGQGAFAHQTQTTSSARITMRKVGTREHTALVESNAKLKVT